jgi:hypothetical protein
MTSMSWRDGTFQGYGKGHSVALVENNRTRFFISTNAWSRWTSNSGGPFTVDDFDRVEGVRYFIFAIPQ